MVISFVAPALFWEKFVGFMYPWHHPRKLFCQVRPLRSGPCPTPTQAPTQPGRRSQALLLSSLSPSYHPSRRFSSLHYYRAITPSILPI